MSIENRKKISVKVGSGLVTNGDGQINHEFILEVCRQISILQRKNHRFTIISSGAIASEPDTSLSLNLRAVIGQPDVSGEYKAIFKKFKIKSGQVLVTDHDLRGLVLPRVLKESFEKNVILVLNANDGTDDKEMKAYKECADNDILTKNVCLIPDLYFDHAIIGIDMPGFLDDNGKVIPVIHGCDAEKCRVYAKGGSKLGHGEKGALTKFNVCCELASKGIKTILAPGREEDFILRAFKRLEGSGENDFGTLFLP